MSIHEASAAMGNAHPEWILCLVREGKVGLLLKPHS